MSDTCDIICFTTREKTQLAQNCAKKLQAIGKPISPDNLVAKISGVPIEEIKERRQEVLHQGPDDEIREVLALFSAPLLELIDSFLRKIKHSQIDTLDREQAIDLLVEFHLAATQAIIEHDNLHDERFGDETTDPTG